MTDYPRWFIYHKLKYTVDWYPYDPKLWYRLFTTEGGMTEAEIKEATDTYADHMYVVERETFYKHIPVYPKWMSINRKYYKTYLTYYEGSIYEIFYYPRASLMLKHWQDMDKVEAEAKFNINSMNYEGYQDLFVWREEILLVTAQTNKKLSPIRDRIMKNLPEMIMETML